ncbi:MAG TPA: hypothetical protein VHL09_08975, partial [Dehalococcoidia bacterium]|nr:hypothetical protein [Dehalococcoidia bacterium]
MKRVLVNAAVAGLIIGSPVAGYSILNGTGGGVATPVYAAADLRDRVGPGFDDRQVTPAAKTAPSPSPAAKTAPSPSPAAKTAPSPSPSPVTPGALPRTGDLALGGLVLLGGSVLGA